MKRSAFFVFGAIYLLMGSMSERMFLVTTILLGIYGCMFLYALYVTIRYRAMNPIVLLLVSVFMILYTWFSWSDKTFVYRPDGIHSLVGLILIFYGILFPRYFKTD